MTHKPESYDTSALAYEVLALIDTCRYALENDTSATPIEHRGIDRTLEVASERASALLDYVELLEKDPARRKEVSRAA